MGQINIGDADNAAMAVGNPTAAEFNMLVSKVNEIIGRLESLPNGGCSIVKWNYQYWFIYGSSYIITYIAWTLEL